MIFVSMFIHAFHNMNFLVKLSIKQKKKLVTVQYTFPPYEFLFALRLSPLLLLLLFRECHLIHKHKFMNILAYVVGA